MNLDVEGLPTGLAGLAVVCAVFGALFWMYVASRATCARERMAAAAERTTIAQARTPLPRVSDGPVRNG